MRYRSDITVGSLKVCETRAVAGLLLNGVDAQQWCRALYEENVLQTRRRATAERVGRLVRHRLETMEARLWQLVRDGSAEVATQACLAAAVKHSRLLGDFLDLVVREQYRVFNPTLSNRLWQSYVQDCRGRDPEMPEWSGSTVARLRSSVFQSLAQAGYLESTRSLRLQAVHLAREVLQYLQEHDEHRVLRCIQVSP